MIFLLPKAFQFNCSAAFTERRKIEHGLSEENEATNPTEAEKLSLSSQLTFLKVPSNSTIFPDSKLSKNKKHKDYKQCGYWSLTKNYHERWTCRGLSETCQPFKTQSCAWGPRGAHWSLAGKHSRTGYVFVRLFRTAWKHKCTFTAVVSQHIQHTGSTPNYLCTQIQQHTFELLKRIASPEISQAKKSREIKPHRFQISQFCSF